MTSVETTTILKTNKFCNKKSKWSLETTSERSIWRIECTCWIRISLKSPMYICAMTKRKLHVHSNDIYVSEITECIFGHKNGTRMHIQRVRNDWCCCFRNVPRRLTTSVRLPYMGVVHVRFALCPRFSFVCDFI